MAHVPVLLFVGCLRGEMGRSKSWKRTTQVCDAPKRKKWFKQMLHRRNRRKAKRNPESQDNRLDAWAFD